MCIMGCNVRSCNLGVLMAGCDVVVTKSRGATIRRVCGARSNVVVAKDCSVGFRLTVDGSTKGSWCLSHGGCVRLGAGHEWDVWDASDM